MKYWPQQLHFAVSARHKGVEFLTTKQNKSASSDESFLYLPHVFHGLAHFVLARSIAMLGGIQSMSALPEDPTFNPFNNHYDVASYKRICNEFGIDPSSDFRFTRGANRGLGSVYVYADGATKTEFEYPEYNKLSDEGGKAIKGNLIYFIETGDAADNMTFQLSLSFWFVLFWQICS